MLTSALLALCLAALNAASASAAAPIITNLHVSEVTTTSVVLNATIDPQGKGTRYRFEYGTEDCEIGSCVKTPFPEPIIGAASPPTEVSVPVTGLSEATAYHYRVVAENTDGTKSKDRRFATDGPPKPIFPACPNDEPFRTDRPSENLPDCRAYEQASPVFKNGEDATGAYLTVKAALNGEAVSFITTSGTPSSSGTQEPPMHLAMRGSGNWLTHGLLPPQEFGQRAGVIGWTPDFSHVFIEAARFTTPETKALLDMAPDGSITEVLPYRTGRLIFGYVGASADGSKVFFEAATDPLSKEATAGKNNLYAWDRASGQLSLVGLLPDAECATAPCAPAGGSMGGPYDWVNGAARPGLGGALGKYYTQAQRAISSSGKSAYFTAGATGQLYRRLNPTGPGAQTVHVSASEKKNGGGEGGVDVNGTRPAAFMGASADGSAAFFTSSEKLTDEATTGPEPDEGPSIARAELSDGSEKKLDFLAARAYGIAVHGEFIYWADPEKSSISRAKLDGTEVKDPFIVIPEIEVEPGVLAPPNPQYVAVDDEHIYWTNAPAETTPGERKGTVGWAKLDGTDVNAELITGASNPKGIALDGTYVYWANSCPGEKGVPKCPVEISEELRTIGRAELDGSSPEGEFISVDQVGAERDPQGIAVNATHIYMAMNGNQEFGFLLRYDIGGGGEKVLVDAKFKEISGLRGIALDDSFVYWSREGRNSIGRIPLDLKEENAEREWLKDAHGPKGLAIDAQHVYWSANQEVLANPGNDLYRYSEKASADGKHLSDLVIDKADKNGAEVRGVVGISPDGSHVYFVANGIPDGVTNSPNGEGESAAPGDCREVLETSGSRACNLYLWHEGQISFIARLSEVDSANWSGTVAGVEIALTHYQTPARVSADGRTLLFRSRRDLSNYESKGKAQLYRYVAGNAAPSCISCDPSGEAPTGPGARNIETPILSNETIPASTLTRSLSEDGRRAFFETTDALVPGDVNGVGGCPTVGSEFQEYSACQDVYEWEAKGSGSCDSEAQNGGCVYLISSGKSSEPSLFADASADGEDVLFFTRESLVRQDADKLFDVYDARVGGGLAAQEALPEICDSKEACEGPLPPSPPEPEFPNKGSVSPENPKPRPKACPKGKHRVKAKGKKKSRCVAKKPAHKGGKAKRRAEKSGRAGR